MDAQSKIDQAKGRVEKTVGAATDDDDLQAQGERHETGGKLKEKIGDLKDKLDGVVEGVEGKIDNIAKKDSDTE